MKLALRIFEISLWLIGAILLSWPAFQLSIGHFESPNGGLFWSLCWGTAINAIIFYGNSKYLMPHWLSKHRRRAYFQYLIAGFVSVTILEATLDYVLLKSLGTDVPWLDAELHGVVWFFNLLFLFLSFAYGFFRIWLNNTQLQKALEKEKLTAELNFLRTQINPHFLFNTLNNLFALSRRNGDHVTSEQLARLAGMMRYMLYDTNAEKVSLKKELDYIKDYIELQKIRFQASDPITVNCVWPEEPSNLKLSPFLIIPFVENAFQHGISLTQASSIEINCAVRQGQLNFSLKNTNHSSKAKEVGGIGLANVKKRLALLYPDKHELNISSGKAFFHVTLNIDCRE